MKKKITKTSLIFLSIIFVFYFQSCKQEPLSEKYAALIANNYNYQEDPLFAPLNEAVEIASNVNKSNIVLKIVAKTAFKSLKHQGKKKVKNYFTVTDKGKKNPYLYVVNYDGGGYSIISADKRVMPILAYGDNGYFNIDSLPSGVSNWLEASASAIQYSRSMKVAQTSSVAYQWSSLGCDQELVSFHNPSTSNLKSAQMYQCPPPPPPTSSETTVTVGPLLKTTWSQGCGYNTYCPYLFQAPCEHAYTGCSTTAVAQVMAYWKYPASYDGLPLDWDIMTMTYGNDRVARLMGDIFPKVINPNQITTSSSACTNEYNIRNAFTETFNYSSAELAGWVNGFTYNGGYDYQKVVNSLTNLQPVILVGSDSYTSFLGIPISAGDTHVWVCDGYMQTTYFENGAETSQSLYFSMNWGWDNGQYNNWYAFMGWETPQGNFQYLKTMIYNIHP